MKTSFIQKFITLSLFFVITLPVFPDRMAPIDPTVRKYQYAETVITAKVIKIIRDETKFKATKKQVSLQNSNLQKNISSFNEQIDAIKYPTKKEIKRNINENLVIIRKLKPKILELRKRLRTGKFVLSSSYAKLTNHHKNLQEDLIQRVSKLKKDQKTIREFKNKKITLSPKKIKKINNLTEKIFLTESKIKNNNITNKYDGSIKIEMELLKKHKGKMQFKTQKIVLKSFNRNLDLSKKFLYKLKRNNFIILFYNKNNHIFHYIVSRNKIAILDAVKQLENGQFSSYQRDILGSAEIIYNKATIKTSRDRQGLSMLYFPEIPKNLLNMKKAGRNERKESLRPHNPIHTLDIRVRKPSSKSSVSSLLDD